MSCLEKDEYVLGKDVDMFFQCLFNSGGTSNKNNHYAKISIPDTNEEPFSLKLIQSKFVAFPEQPYRIPPVKEDDEPYAFYVPGVKDISILFPAFSSLNQKEQSILYHYQCLQYFKVRKLTESENAEFKELLKKANNDFSAYQSFVHNQWVRHHYKRSLQILPGVQMFTDHLWHTKAKQCLGLYPECYKLIDGIPLALNDPNGDWAVLDCWKDLMKRGAPPRLTLPKLKKPCILLTEYSDLCKIKEVFPEDKSLKVESICHPRLPVSLDPNVDACLAKFDNIDVVITSSGVKSIVDIDKFNKDWILPVTVKDVFLQDGETRKKIVIIDKKLPPSHMSVHDKNVWHTKIATKWALILNNAPNLLDSYGTTLSTKDERQLMQYDDLMSEDLDLFRENSIPLNRSDQRDIEPRKTSRDSCLRKPQTVSDPNLEECEVFNIKQFMKSTEYKHPSSNVCEQGREERKSEPTSFFPQGGSLPVRQFSDKGINPCNQYMLWQLHKNKHVYMVKQEHRTLNILVRTRIDGKMIYSDKANKRCVEDVCVSSKVELQPEYGASRMTYSELVREYVDLYLRPSAKLVRVRSVGHTNEVMLNEIRSIVEIREALQAKNVSTNKIFDPLYAVLTKLIDLPVGKYLLQHSAKMGAFTQLMVEDPKGLNFNMPKYCCELRSSDVTVPPTQVDPFVITRVHSRDKIPPALFKPCSTHKNSRFFRKSEPSQLPSGRKRKRTKKKKKPISKS